MSRSDRNTLSASIALITYKNDIIMNCKLFLVVTIVYSSEDQRERREERGEGGCGVHNRISSSHRSVRLTFSRGYGDLVHMFFVQICHTYACTVYRKVNFKSVQLGVRVERCGVRNYTYACSDA